MDLAIVAILFFLGILLLVLELFVVTGTTFVGLAGLLFLIISVYWSYENFGMQTGNYVLGAAVITTIIAVFWFIKSGIWKKMIHSENITGRVNLLDEYKIKVGDEGVALSELRPSGKALINGVRVEVDTLGEYVDENFKIKVVKITENKIFVKPISTED